MPGGPRLLVTIAPRRHQPAAAARADRGAGGVGRPRRRLKPLVRMRLGRPVSGRLALAVLAGVGSAAAAIGLAATSAWLISRAAEQPPVLVPLVAVTAVRACGISRGVLRYAERLAAHDAAFRVLGELRADVYARLARLAPAGLAELRAGDLLARLVGDVDTLADLWLRVLLPYLAAGLVAAGAVLLVGSLVPGAGVVLGAAIAVAAVGAPPPPRRRPAGGGRPRSGARRSADAGGTCCTARPAARERRRAAERRVVSRNRRVAGSGRRWVAAVPDGGLVAGPPPARRRGWPSSPGSPRSATAPRRGLPPSSPSPPSPSRVIAPLVPAARQRPGWRRRPAGSLGADRPGPGRPAAMLPAGPFRARGRARYRGGADARRSPDVRSAAGRSSWGPRIGKSTSLLRACSSCTPPPAPRSWL